MKQYRKSYQITSQFYRSLAEFVSQGLSSDEYAIFQVHNLVEKLKSVSQWFGSVDAINNLLEITEFYQLFNPTLSQYIKQDRSVISRVSSSRDLKRTLYASPYFSSPGLLMILWNSTEIKLVGFSHPKKSQYSRNYLQQTRWQIESNSAESICCLEILNELSNNVEVLHRLKESSLNTSEHSNLSCIRLVENFLWERRFIETQLQMISDMPMSREMSNLVFKIETFLEELTKKEYLEWIIKYVTHSFQLTRMVSETQQLVLKLQYQVDTLNERYSTGQTTTEDTHEPSRSKNSIMTTKTKPVVYKSETPNSWKNTCAMKASSYQHTLINHEDPKYSSSSLADKHKSVDVLDYNYEPDKNFKQKRPYESTEEKPNQCLSCQMF